MQVLVSVRSADEVVGAVAGGADVIDAKEPDRGPLGPVSATTLEAIARALPSGCPLSVALGDPSGPAALAEAFDAVSRLPVLASELVVKIGLAGVRNQPAMDLLLRSGLGLARRLTPAARLMAVTPIDRGLAPEDVTAAAASAGIDGVVLDTWHKDGRDLFAWMNDAALQQWIDLTRARGLRTGVAGSLSREGIGRAARLGPDIVGARGAACKGGRSGKVEESLVRDLVRAVRQASTVGVGRVSIAQS